MRALSNILILGLFLCAPALASQQAVLEAVGGAESVLVKRDGKDLQLKQGAALRSGDELVTGKGTAVDVRLSDRSLIRVGANSSYTLSLEPAGFLHKLISGIVRVMVPPDSGAKKGEVRFRMNTPEGTIGVRGTEFVVIRDRDETTLKGLEGEVMFGPAGADFAQESAFVMVVKGFQSSVRKGGNPSSPSKFDEVGYVKDLNGKRAAFASLAERKQGAVKARSKPVVVAAAPKSMPSPQKAVPKKVAAMSKAKAEPQEKASPNVMLFEAANAGLLERVQELVEKEKADVNYVDEEGFTPLHMAVNGGHLKVADYLIEKGAEVNAVTKSGDSALMVAVEVSRNAEIAFLLMQHGARADLPNDQNATPLSQAKANLAKAKSKEDKELHASILAAVEAPPKKEN